VLTSALIRQDLVPMLAGYLIIMTTLGLGLLRLRRPGSRGREARGRPDRPDGGSGSRRGWLLLARHAITTAAGGYLLLMAVVIAYYYGVARVGGAFLKSAFTGTALLIGLALPLFAGASWLAERRREKRETPAADPRPRRR
jgi:hypothetical protein